MGDVVMAILNSSYISAYVAEAPWIFPAALLIILVPAFLLSWGLEYWIAKKLLLNGVYVNSGDESLSPSSIRRAVRRVNFVSYILLYSYAHPLSILKKIIGFRLRPAFPSDIF
jgi:hypothetical protein